MAINSKTIQHQYKEYVNPMDLNIFASVMQHQQQKFDRGAQAIQSKIDGFASLDVIANEDKQYLNEKIQATLKGINEIGGANLSDSSVVQQLSSYVGSIAKDERIINSVLDTKKIRNLQTGRETINKDYNAGKKGVYRSDANEYFENKAVQSYLESKKQDPTARYNGPSSPIAYTDYYKKQMEAAKAMKASAVEVIKGTDNKYLYTINGVKNLSEEDIWEAAAKSLSEEDRGQMSRDATYHYKSASDNQIISEFTETNRRKLEQLKHAKDNLASTYAVASPEEKANLEANIKRYEDKIRDTSIELQRGLTSNREAVVGKLFENRFLEGLAKRFSYREEKIKPLWNQGAIHLDNLNQKESQYTRTLNFNVAKERNDQRNFDKQYDLEVQKFQHQVATATLSDGTKVDASTTFVDNSLKGEAEYNTTDILRQSNADLLNKKNQEVQKFYNDYAKLYDDDKTLFTRVNGNAVPTEAWKKAHPKLVKAANDIANGRPTEITSLPEEFVTAQKRIHDIELELKTNQNKINSITAQTVKLTRAELGAKGKDMTEQEWSLYEQGRVLHNTHKVKLPNTVMNMGTGMAVSTGPGGYSEGVDTSTLTPQQRKAYEVFLKRREDVGPLLQKNLKKVETDMSLRENYVGVTLNNQQLKSRGLLNGMLAQNKGYYTMGDNNEIEDRPEDGGGTPLSESNFEAIGVVKRNLSGKGLENFVIGNVTTKDGTTNVIKRVYIPVDDKFNQSLLTSVKAPSGKLDDYLDRDEYNEYIGKSYSEPVKGRVDLAVDYRIVKTDEGYRVQIKQPYDEKGNPLSKPVWVPISTKYSNVDVAYKMANDIAQEYKNQQRLAAAQGINLSFRDFVLKHP